VLVRGGEVLERLAQVSRVWLDKTGTLTRGDLTLDALELSADLDEREALRIAASLELGSEHPIGRALLKEWFSVHGGEQAAALEALSAVEDFRALPGLGVEGRIGGALWSIGRGEGAARGAVSLARGEDTVAMFRLHAEPRPEAKEVIRELKRLGLKPTILTGDAEAPAEALAEKLGIPVESGLLPADKVERIRAAGAVGTLFVGDGLNDAAALAAADVGIAVAGGSARSMEAAPINLLRPGLSALPELLRLSRAATGVARGNLIWAFGYNAIGLFLAVRGELTPILAAAAMVASSLAVVLNSGRLATRVAEELGDRASTPPSSTL
jgi:Cu+-exporting ATPase